jgi:pseudouridine-5'-phosphate glycosidase
MRLTLSRSTVSNTGARLIVDSFTSAFDNRRFAQLIVHPEIQAALDAGRPVVALESTLITHGLPRPDNLEVARALEAAVRESGAVPATIAILSGRITVGLSDEQLAYLAGAENVRKCSRRDLPIVVGRGEDGATTVAGTMIAAHMAGIRVFATGGIGGVHRGHPFDVSADLIELGRTPVTVVCAGAKAILDLPLTLEVLETQGVPVIGYGTDEFPAFYTRSSGLPVDVRCDTPEEVAAIVRARDALSLPGGIRVAAPIPPDDELPAAEAEAAIARALAEAEAGGIKGKAVTPFLLARVNELTGAASLRANVALLLNNARVASGIAVALGEGSVKRGASNVKRNVSNVKRQT